jgi:hypothetical protein
MLAILQQPDWAVSSVGGTASFPQKEASDITDPPTMTLEYRGERE